MMMKSTKKKTPHPLLTSEAPDNPNVGVVDGFPATDFGPLAEGSIPSTSTFTTYGPVVQVHRTPRC